MTSRRKRKLSQQNNPKPAGPKLPHPLTIATQIAEIHGLTPGSMVLYTESKSRFEHLRQAYIRQFLPQNAVEMGFVNEMTAARWRQQRIWDIQTASIDHQMESLEGRSNGFDQLQQHKRVAVAFNELGRKEGFDLLLRYETSYSRMHDRAMKALHRFREEQKLQNDPNPEEFEPFEALPEPVKPAPSPEKPVQTPEEWIRQLQAIYDADKPTYLERLKLQKDPNRRP